MDPLEALAEDLPWPDSQAGDDARAVLDDPDGDLGRLGELAIWWASVRGSAVPGAPASVVLVGGSPAVAARRPGLRVADLPPVDASVDAASAVALGAAAADELADAGTDLVLLCLDATEAARAVAAELLGLDVLDASGWPADRDLDDVAWMDAVAALRDRLYRLRGLGARPAELALQAGDPRLAVASGFVLRCAVRRVPLLLDGPGAAAVAMVTRRAAYSSSSWWQATHQVPGRLHERLLTSLVLSPPTALQLRREDGTGALAGLAVLETAAGLLGGPAGA